MCSVERAKTFWAAENVDQAFSGIFEYLDHLKRVLKRKTATDKGADLLPGWVYWNDDVFPVVMFVLFSLEYIQALRLLESLDCSSIEDHQDQDSSVVQVVIGSGKWRFGRVFMVVLFSKLWHLFLQVSCCRLTVQPPLPPPPSPPPVSSTGPTSLCLLPAERTCCHLLFQSSWSTTLTDAAR